MALPLHWVEMLTWFVAAGILMGIWIWDKDT